MGPLLVHLLIHGVLLFDALAWQVTMPKSIHGLQGSCLVIPCSFSYTSYPPTNPRRVVWYQWVSKGYPLVYDPWYPSDVIEKFRWKTDLYRGWGWDCSLLIKRLEQSHHGEEIYAWIDPENVGWRTYKFYEVTSTIFVDSRPQAPSISIYGGERMGDRITVTCSTFHSCPYSRPDISLYGVKGSDEINQESFKNGQWKISLTRTGVIRVERYTIECSVTHYGGRRVTATKDKTAQCVHEKISIEPELADVTEGVTQNFICTVYHSCQKENPSITWNYENMPVSKGSKTLSGVNRISYSSITFLSTKDDHGKKLICTARFSGGGITASVVLRVQRVLQYDALGLEVRIPKDIHGLQGSCLVIPCSFRYTSKQPKKTSRVVWYQWATKGNPLVCDPQNANKVIEKFRGKTQLYGNSNGNCSLLIKNLEPSHDREKLYTWIDPDNVPLNNNKYNDVTSTILVDENPQQPSIDVYGGEKIGDKITVLCWTFHTCPYSRPNIILKGVKGSDEIKHESFKDGQWKISLTRTGVIQVESSTIECSVTHYGGRRVTATKVNHAQCVHEKISIEPELADVTEGVTQNFICTVYHSCQKENPSITWNYENMLVSKGSKTLSGVNRISYSNITFLGTIEDHGKKLICTAKFSGGNIEASVVLHVKQYKKPDPIINETYFQYMADVIPKITALPRSCVVIPCSFSLEDEYVTRLRVLWVDKKGGYMFHTNQLKVLDNFKGRTNLLGNPDEQNCTVEMDNVQTHDNGPFCFQAEKENEKYSFNNSCVFIIMRASPNKPVMSSLPEDIKPGTRVSVKCSVNHTCSSHPPKITWSVPTTRETVSHNHMGGGVWETESAVTFTPTGYEETDEIVCSAMFWGGKTQSNTGVLTLKRVQAITLEVVGLYAIAPSLVFVLICVLIGVCLYNRRKRGDRNDIRFTPERPPKPERRSIWSRFSRRQSPRTNADLRAEYKANNSCTVSGIKPFSKPHMASPEREPKSYHVYY